MDLEMKHDPAECPPCNAILQAHLRGQEVAEGAKMKPCRCGQPAQMVFSGLGGDYSVQCSHWRVGYPKYVNRLITRDWTPELQEEYQKAKDAHETMHGQPWLRWTHSVAYTPEDAIKLWNDGVIL